MKAGRRKEEKNWLVILAAMVLRYRSTIYFVALEEIAIASALLRGSLVLSGPLARGYVPWPFAVPVTKSVFVSVHAPMMVACASVCANGGWAGVCLRVHYVDCWSRPLRRTQRTSKRFGGLKRAGAKTVGKRARRKKKGKGPFLSPVSKRTVRCILDAHGF